jgi:hypothetical protein
MNKNILKTRHSNFTLLIMISGTMLLFILATFANTITDNIFAQTSNSLIKNNNVTINSYSLGKPVYLENTKSTSTRVLDITLAPTVEVSYMGNGTLGNFITQIIGTTVNKMSSDGAVNTKGQAILTANNGQVITYTTQSRGYYNFDGSFTDSGVMIFNMPFLSSSNSPNDTHVELSNFDNMVGIYQKTVDKYGYGLTKVWNWK